MKALLAEVVNFPSPGLPDPQSQRLGNGSRVAVVAFLDRQVQERPEGPMHTEEFARVVTEWGSVMTLWPYHLRILRELGSDWRPASLPDYPG